MENSIRPKRVKHCYLFSEEAAHHGCGLTLHAISQQSPDILRRHATLAMPLAFLAMHEKKEGKYSRKGLLNFNH